MFTFHQVLVAEFSWQSSLKLKPSVSYYVAILGYLLQESAVRYLTQGLCSLESWKSLEICQGGKHFFSKLQQVLHKWNLFRFGQILFNLNRTFAAHHERSFVPVFLKVSIDHLFDSLSRKRNYCFGKMYGKSVQFGICTKPVNNNF